MADDSTDIVEQVKQANPIEDVIEATGFPLITKRGRYLRCRDHNSLVIDTHQQAYHWNSKHEAGDVITWLEKRNNWDFKTAVEWLAQRAHLPAPNWGKQDNQTRLATRAREDAWQVAQRVFARWLCADPEALEYVHSRGWNDETIEAAGLGFSGRATAAAFSDMRGEFAMHEIDPESPNAVAILGFKGDVKRWGEKWNVIVQENWVEWGLIPGMMGRKRLVYPHILGGRVRYLSARNILGDEVNREGREVKSFNLPVALAGPRQVYFNHVYGARAETCVIVEGQADAVTLAQWDLPAVAMAGTSWSDHEPLLGELKNRHQTVYIGLDGDAAGLEALRGREKDWPLAQILGPMLRVVQWDGGKTVKDANDWLQQMAANGVDADQQREQVQSALAAAHPVALAAAKWAGSLRGAEQDQAVKTAFKVIARMDKMMAAKYREKLAAALGLGIRDFNNVLKEARNEIGAGDDDERPGEIRETLGGYIGGYLVDYLYDEEQDKVLFAYRDPDGRIDTAPHLDIEGVRYIPKMPNSLVRSKGILFPSAIGKQKTTRELVAIVEAFIHQHYLLDDVFFGRLAAYYVLLTWLFDCFNALPYLRAVGDYGSGKSQLMVRIGHVCYRMMVTGGAGSSSSLFRALHEFRGTAFMDEMDLSGGGEMENDLVKILNLGAMANNPVWRLTEVKSVDGTRGYEVEAFNIFGPKLIAMRGDFRDQAVASRCLTIKLMAKEPMELKARGIKLHLDDSFYQQALSIRNLLLRWRLEKWRPEIEVTEELMDLAVPARLNQVTMPIKAIAQDDPELMRDITTFVRALNEELILERGMGLDARVMDAIVAVLEDEKYKSYRFEGECGPYGTVVFAYTKHLAKIANELMDEMNQAEGSTEEDDGRKKPKGTTSQTVGKIARQDLQLHAYRKNQGYVIILDPEKIAALKVKYGLARPEDLPGNRMEVNP